MAVATTNYVSILMDPASEIAASCMSMDKKDSFMRFVVAGSIVAVGLLALFISMNS